MAFSVFEGREWVEAARLLPELPGEPPDLGPGPDEWWVPVPRRAPVPLGRIGCANVLRLDLRAVTGPE